MENILAKKLYDKVIIGGGASAMVAAISSKIKGYSTLIIEINDNLARKLYATGNGRCNFTNTNLSLSNYYVDNKGFLEKAFARFDEKDTIKFFEKLGLEICERNGYVYPRTLQAKSVVGVLTQKIKALQIDVLTSAVVTNIEKTRDTFLVNLKKDKREEKIKAYNIIVATGLMASSFAREKCFGLEIAKKFNINYTEPLPALVKLKVDNKYWKNISGVRANAKISLYIDEKYECFEVGEIQFTDDAISGIPVFQISRIATKAIKENKQVHICVNFIYDILDNSDIYRDACDYILKRKNNIGYKKTKQFMTGLLNDKVSLFLLRQNNIPENILVNNLSKEEIESLSNSLANYKVKITDSYGMRDAQVCSGGIDIDELDENMQSKKIKGLFFAGELIDVDGKCGGYNLQWAWTSGYIAGESNL